MSRYASASSGSAKTRARSSESQATRIWGFVAGTMLMGVVYVLATFTVVLPSSTELIDFPSWYEVSLVGLVAISALVATTHPLDVSDHLHFRKWFSRLRVW